MQQQLWAGTVHSKNSHFAMYSNAFFTNRFIARFDVSYLFALYHSLCVFISIGNKFGHTFAYSLFGGISHRGQLPVKCNEEVQ